MAKILSQSGNSLADIYDVEGSVAGIEQLETRDLPIMHEMGATVMSERFTTRIIRLSTTGIAQNLEFRIEIGTLPETPARLLGIQVISDNSGRIVRAAVVATDPTLQQDIPLWVWDAAGAVSEAIIMFDATVSAAHSLLIPHGGANIFPSFCGGREQQDSMVSSLTLTGRTTGFGAGTVVITALCYLAFPRRDINISSKGVPIPSW